MLYFTLGFLAVGFILFIQFVYPFLAVNHRVDADVLIVEGWLPGYMLPLAVKEFHQGKYTRLFVSGLNDPGANQTNTIPDAMRTATWLQELGVPREALMPCPAPFARWLRTSKSARAVRDKIAELGIKPKGVNIMTADPHARETWVAYQHLLGHEMPVGIIPIPRNEYPAKRWWLDRRGWYWVAKNLLAWLKEVFFGLRS